MSQPLAGNHSPPPAASAPNLVFKDKRAVENISKQLVYDHEFHSGLRNSQAGQTPQATGEVGYPDVFPHPMFTTPRNPPPLPDKELTLAHNTAAPGVPLRPSSKAEAAGTHTTVLGPSSFAHPVRVLGLVGNGLCLHGCREAGAREDLGGGSKGCKGRNGGKLAHKLAVSDSQALRLHHVRLVPVGAAMLKTGRSLEGSRGRKKRQSRPSLLGTRWCRGEVMWVRVCSFSPFKEDF